MKALPESDYLTCSSPDDVRIAGTRVGIEQLLEGYQAGATAEELAIEFPTLTLEQVYGVIAYYLRNRDAIDVYLRNWQETSAVRQYQTQPTSEVVIRLRDLAKQQAAG